MQFQEESYSEKIFVCIHVIGRCEVFVHVVALLVKSYTMQFKKKRWEITLDVSLWWTNLFEDFVRGYRFAITFLGQCLDDFLCHLLQFRQMTLVDIWFLLVFLYLGKHICNKRNEFNLFGIFRWDSSLFVRNFFTLWRRAKTKKL